MIALLLGALQAVFGRRAAEMAEIEDDAIKSSIRPALRSMLGKHLQLKLPGKNFEHERLYLHAALAKLAEGSHPHDWYYLIWLVARGLPSGLLPAHDALADIPGQDGNPIHACIRSWVLDQADGGILVMDSKQHFHTVRACFVVSVGFLFSATFNAILTCA